ncbi:MAG: hypothetical protein OHK0029_20700 [Armatimonadaceae bacterium]
MIYSPERPLAELLRRQMIQVIERYGSTVTYTRGTEPAATSIEVRARVSPMSNNVRFPWFRSDESATWESPAYVVSLAGDFRPLNSEPQTGDRVTLPTGDYTVRKWDKVRIGDTVIRTTLYVARTASP